MMTQSHRGKGAWLRLAATLPVIATTFFAFGCGTKNQEELETKVDLTSETPDPSIFRIQVTGGNGGYSILCNGEPTEIDKIGELVAEFYAGEEMYNATVSLSADGNVPMGIITDIKVQLRDARALKIRYETEDSAIERRMPPAQTSSPAISDEPYSKVNRRNIIVIRVNPDGEMLLGANCVKGSLHNEELYRQEINRLKDYISNPTNSEDCPSVEMRDIQMPDGSSRR